MRKYRRSEPGPVVHAMGVVGAPVCVIGMAYGGALYAVNGRPESSVFVGNALVVVAFIGACASGALCDSDHPWQPFVAVVTSVVLAAGVLAVVSFVDGEILRTRGEPTRCTVLDVDRQVHTTTYTDSNGMSHTSTRIDYKHTLDCAAGRPHTMRLDEKWASRGERIAVTYDPRGRIGPRPTETIGKDGVWHTLAFVCPPVAVGGRGAVLFAAFWSRRRDPGPKRF
ncbi:MULTISPECIES: hypothetical protein [unclassified Streptomyces]|uniref:hypothetical protein n=1 Tax=unclassified Streptomyces TaxID=2593676 RepID=UPI002DD7A2AC|nr:MULTISPECIES: hypothetical protein [unclassified Streptomyces]WSA91179.1 hypothetical protein OIE63_06175 [Streptomyces sp. NBC_01795]WSB75504.1 hypothetical protein OHB04_06705 [Streptomyces sp. NBC_01775]WSS16213.1 hypothetical protein OG533_33190 [Streptomyces sp. NBC_01186]WSS45031.1 hypothetical protein OG220_33865 [Streptomyces sp. NBC_01187]